MVATMVKPVLGVLAANPVDGLQHGFFQGLIGTGGAGAQLGFELAPGLLDGGKIGGVGGQKDHIHAALGQPLAQPAEVVHEQVVEHQHVAPAQGGGQAPADVEGETVLVEGLMEQLQGPKSAHG